MLSRQKKAQTYNDQWTNILYLQDNSDTQVKFFKAAITWPLQFNVSRYSLGLFLSLENGLWIFKNGKYCIMWFALCDLTKPNNRDSYIQHLLRYGIWTVIISAQLTVIDQQWLLGVPLEPFELGQGQVGSQRQLLHGLDGERHKQVLKHTASKMVELPYRCWYQQ